MSRRIILSPDARAHVTSAIRWYQRREAGLAFRFRAEAQLTIRRIARNPYQFPLVDLETRRALMTRFPYSVYFTLNQGHIFVIGVRHQHSLGIGALLEGTGSDERGVDEQ